MTAGSIRYWKASPINRAITWAANSGAGAGRSKLKKPARGRKAAKAPAKKKAAKKAKKA